MATVVSPPFVENQITKNIDEIKRQLNLLIFNTDKINDGLSGLNILNILALQKGVNDLGNQLEKMSQFNSNVDKFNKLFKEFNHLLVPLNELANEKNSFSKKEAEIKEKEFLVSLAKMKAKDTGISEWKAYTMLIADQSYVYHLLSATTGLIIGHVSYRFISKL
jgi:hypothetical protein